MGNPLVSYIIVTWNNEKDIVNCIESLKNQTYKNYEIILVDNNSSDQSVEIIKRNFKDVKIIQNKKNLGFAQGSNIGIKNSKGDVIAFVNPDVIADKNWLEILLSKLNHSDKIVGVTGKMYYLGKQFGNNRVFCTWSKINSVTAQPYNFTDDEPESKVDYLSGAAMLVKKKIIERVGLLDPDYFLYFEETDWCAKIIRTGYELWYVPEAKVWHAVSSSSNSEKKIYYMDRNRFRFAIKNFDTSYIPIFLIIYFAESLFLLLRDLKRNNFQRSKLRFKGLWWNFSQIGNILNERRKFFSILQKLGSVQSYNKSLPLRKISPK